MRIKNFILLSSIITLSKGLIFRSNVEIYKNNGIYKANLFYNDIDKIIGYQFLNPDVVYKLYDFNNNLLYKSGYFIKSNDYFDDLYGNLNNSSDSDFKEDSEEYSQSSDKEKTPIYEIIKKYEIKYQYHTFHEINSLLKEKVQNLDYNDLLKDSLNRSYLEPDFSYTKRENVKGDYNIYKNDKLVEFKFNDNVLILHDYQDIQAEEIIKTFEINSTAFNHQTPKCTNEYDIIFLIDENGNIAEQEWIKTLDFCKRFINNFDIKYSKSRFGIVGFGSFGVKHLDLTDSRYTIMKKLDEMRTKQLRGGVCVGCGLSIVSEMFAVKKNKDVKQILISLMASDVNNPIYKGECIQELQNITYNKYCLGCCNKLEHEFCEYELSEDCKVENKVFNITGYNSFSICNKRRYKDKGFSCSDCFCNDNKNYLMCKTCTIDSAYSYARCKSTTQFIGCKSEFNLSDVYDYSLNYTKSVNEINKITDLIKINIGLGDFKLRDRQIKDLSNIIEGVKTDYFINSYDDLNDTIINSIVPVLCKLHNNKEIGECGKDCKGFCGINEKCQCPTCGILKNNCLNSYCLADDKYLSSSGCIIENVKCPIDPLKNLTKDPETPGCCVYNDYICPLPTTSEGMIDYCHVGFWNPNIKGCQYKPIEINDNNPCTVDKCSSVDGLITHDLKPECLLKKPENKTIIVNGREITDYIIYEIDSECFAYGDVCVPATFKRNCQNFEPCKVCYGLENGTCQCEDIIYEPKNNNYIAKCVNGIKVEYEDMSKMKECRDYSDYKYALYDFNLSECFESTEKLPDYEYIVNESDCYIKFSILDQLTNTVKTKEFKFSPDPNYELNGVYLTCKNFEITINNIDSVKVIDNRLKIYKDGEYKDYKQTEFMESVVYDSFYDNNLSYRVIPKLPIYEDDNRCRVLYKGNDGDSEYLIYRDKKCTDSPCYYSECEKITGKCLITGKKEECQNKEEIKDIDKNNKIMKCSDDFGCYFENIECNHEYDSLAIYENGECINISICEESTDLCEIPIYTVSGLCLYDKMKCRNSADPDCFIRECENNKCVEHLRYDKFSDICDSCVYKYGDLLGIYNKTGEVCYWHLNKYVKSMFDYIFVIVIVSVIILSSVFGLCISYKKNKGCKKRYEQLKEDVEMEKRED